MTPTSTLAPLPNLRRENIKRLERSAVKLSRLKASVLPRRPIVIEFCGSPKAGKTSCINALAMFLRRNNIRTTVITERGAICPIQNKFDPNFNIWAGCSELTRFAEIMSNSPKDYDVVIMDRGFFDAVTWFHYQTKLLKLDIESYERFVSFFLAPKWMNKIDIVYVFKADPGISLSREHANLITEKHGTIMCPDVLNEFNSSIDECVVKYRLNFNNKIKVIDTSEKSQEKVSFEIADDTLNQLSEKIHEKIGYFDSSLIPNGKILISPDEVLKKVKQFRYDSRDVVENDLKMVQPVPVAVLTDQDCRQVVIARKLNSAVSRSSPERAKRLIYFGGHVREEDVQNQMGQRGTLSVLNAALSRELKEELDIDYVTDQKPKFCIWDNSNIKSAQHLAFVYHVRLNRQSMRIVTDKKEFSEKGVAILDIDKLHGKVGEFESWSREIYTNILS